MNGLYAYALCFAEYEWLISELRFSWKSILFNFYWTTPYEKEARCISIYICFINDAKREQMSYCVLNNINDIVIVLTVPADWAIVRDRPFSPWTTEILNLICDSAFLSISHSDEWSYDLLFSSHSSGSRNIRYASQFLFRDKNLQLFFSSVDAQKSEEIESESERASKRERVAKVFVVCIRRMRPHNRCTLSVFQCEWCVLFARSWQYIVCLFTFCYCFGVVSRNMVEIA